MEEDLLPKSEGKTMGNQLLRIAGPGCNYVPVAAIFVGGLATNGGEGGGRADRCLTERAKKAAKFHRKKSTTAKI